MERESREGGEEDEAKGRDDDREEEWRCWGEMEQGKRADKKV